MRDENHAQSKNEINNNTRQLNSMAPTHIIFSLVESNSKVKKSLSG